MKEKKSIDIGYVAIVVCFVLYFLVFEILNLCYTRYGLSADAAQTGICSKIFWEAKSLHPDNFFAWTESGVFSLATIGAFLYGITGSMLTAQGGSPAILTILILLSVYRLLKCMGTSKKGIAIGMLTMLCIPVGFVRQSLTFLSFAAYAMTVLTLFLVLTDYIQLQAGELRHTGIHIGCQIVLAIANGCNSSRGILDVYAPLCALAVVVYIIKACKEKKLFLLREAKVAIFPMVCFVASYAATYLPCSSRTSGSKALRRSPVKFVTEVLPSLRNWIGVGTGLNFFLNIVLVMLLVATVLLGIYVLYKHDVTSKQQLAIAFMWCDLLFTMFMLSITQTEVVERYFFMVFFLFTCSLVYLFELLFEKKKIATNVAIGILLLYAIVNLVTEYVPILANSPNNAESDEIIAYMVENGYYYGYADYLDANKLTVYADGAVQISAAHMDKMNIWRWTTDKNWYRPVLPEKMETVYLVNKQNEAEFSGMLEKYPDITSVYETEHYQIYLADKNYTYMD